MKIFEISNFEIIIFYVFITCKIYIYLQYFIKNITIFYIKIITFIIFMLNFNKNTHNFKIRTKHYL